MRLRLQEDHKAGFHHKHLLSFSFHQVSLFQICSREEYLFRYNFFHSSLCHNFLYKQVLLVLYYLLQHVRQTQIRPQTRQSNSRYLGYLVHELFKITPYYNTLSDISPHKLTPFFSLILLGHSYLIFFLKYQVFLVLTIVLANLEKSQNLDNQS